MKDNGTANRPTLDECLIPHRLGLFLRKMAPSVPSGPLRRAIKPLFPSSSRIPVLLKRAICVNVGSSGISLAERYRFWCWRADGSPTERIQSYSLLPPADTWQPPPSIRSRSALLIHSSPTRSRSAVRSQFQERRGRQLLVRAGKTTFNFVFNVFSLYNKRTSMQFKKRERERENQAAAGGCGGADLDCRRGPALMAAQGHVVTCAAMVR